MYFKLSPIMIIREVLNLSNASLYDCFHAMEGGILFPIIFETSDNLWYQAPAVKSDCPCKNRPSLH